MASRVASRRLGTKSWQARLATFSGAPRRYASAAAAPTSSNLSHDVRSEIYVRASSSTDGPAANFSQHQASISNPDPPADSPTTAFLNQNAPYMVPTYVRPPPMFVKGVGCRMYDMENRSYLDFTAGIAVNALGHADADVCAVIENQAQQLIHCSNLYYNPWTPTLSKLMVEETRKQSLGSHLSQVFISNSGSEANEAALKFARKVAYAKDPESSQREIVSFHGCFHGRTYGSLSATPNPKYQAPFGPMISGFRYGIYNWIEGLDRLITKDTAGVIVEPIQGEGGVNVATPEFLRAIRERCDAVGAVLIFDEIQCGLSRTGDLWAHTASGVHPDILTTAKALGNGVPIGATLVSGKTVAPFIKTGDHGTTFGGNPLVCRVAHHVFGRLAASALQAEVKKRSKLLFDAFESLKAKFPGVLTEVRGRGLIVGYQLAEDAKDKATEVVTAARERGLLIITAGDGVLRIVPPLVISESEIKEGLKILEQAMEVVFKVPEDVLRTRG